MLNIITLYTIDKILNESTRKKLSVNAKMLYINCLTHHFKDKEATFTDSVAFEIFKSDIPEFLKFERTFEELHKADLVVITFNAISFNNCWGKHIDRSRLSDVAPEGKNIAVGFALNLASTFKDEMLKQETLYELAGMKHKASRKQVETLMELFVKEQDTFKKKYSGISDCIKHFTYWMPNNISKTTHEHVKSKSKLLGED